MSAIVGEWRLLHWRRIINDSAIEYPLGEDAEGVILYLPDGLERFSISPGHIHTM